MAVGELRSSASTLDLYKIWGLLAQLEGSRVAKVLEKQGVFLFQLSSGTMLFSPKRGVSLAHENIAVAGSTRSALLREVEGKRIHAVSIVNDDRVLALDIGNRAVVLEWVREGNIILLDSSGKILNALYQKSMRDRVVRRGEQYKPPPRLGDFSTSPVEVAEKAQKLRRKSIVSALAQATSMPPELILEAAFRLGLDYSGAIDFEGMLRIIDLSRSIYLDSLLERSKGYTVALEGVKVVYPFKPLHLRVPAEEVDFTAVFPEFMTKLILSDALEKPAQPSPAEKASEALLKIETSARLLWEHAPRIEEIINAYRELRGAGTPWGGIEREISGRFPEVKGFKHERWLIVVELQGVEVEVDARKSAYANAGELYGKAKSLRGKVSELGSRGQEPELVVVKPIRRAGGPWYKDFRHFVTSNGFLVVAGKSAGQNELLVRRYMGEQDLFLHADIHGAPAVIIKTGGREVPEKDILEAAQFAACYSSAWKAGLLAIDVYWVHSSQVSKAAPSGEYLGKGAFMIYGKRNWIRGVSLELLIGVGETGLEAIPALRTPEKGCYVKLTPGPLSRELTARKIVESLKRECNVKVKLEEVLRHLPQGTFHVERWVKP